MKRTTILGLCLFIGGTVLPIGQSKSAQRNSSLESFWQKFKTAVISRDKRTVAGLSQFPLIIAESAPKIGNSAELGRRFGEVFDQNANAAQCFDKKGPTPDTENANRYTVVCPVNEGKDFVVYEFEQTKLGWKFIHRQFPSICRCR
jgi:hypothetical protein